MAPFKSKNRKLLKGKARRRHGVSKKKKFGITKSLNYNGYHTFKERCIGTVDFTTDSDGASFKPLSVIFNPSLVNKPTWQFAFNDLTDFSSYNRLFQSAMLTGVRIKIFPNHNASLTTQTDSAGDTTSESIPTLLWKVDNNSTGQPNSMPNLMKRDPHNRYFNKPIVIWVPNPQIQQLVSVNPNTATNPNLANMVRQPKKRQWLNIDGGTAAAGGTVQHGGLNMGLMNATASSTIPYQFIATYYFQCKNIN